MSRRKPTLRTSVEEHLRDGTRRHEDRLATEEPLEIRLGWPGAPARRVWVTMRTPGHDFELATGYRDRGMAAYSELQQAEFVSEAKGYTATRHQREVGTGYFDAVATAISGGLSSTVALKESTEAAQFTPETIIAAE